MSTCKCLLAKGKRAISKICLSGKAISFWLRASVSKTMASKQGNHRAPLPLCSLEWFINSTSLLFWKWMAGRWSRPEGRAGSEGLSLWWGAGTMQGERTCQVWLGRDILEGLPVFAICKGPKGLGWPNRFIEIQKALLGWESSKEVRFATGPFGGYSHGHFVYCRSLPKVTLSKFHSSWSFKDLVLFQQWHHRCLRKFPISACTVRHTAPFCMFLISTQLIGAAILINDPGEKQTWGDNVDLHA